MTTILELKNISKRFGQVVALDNLNLELRAGEVLGLVGQNGSGKSSLMKILAGLQHPDSGEILLRGKPVSIRSAAMATSLGIGMVHQEQSLVPNLTVAENIFIDKPNHATRGGIYRWQALFAAAQAQLDKIGVNTRPDVTVEDLSFAERQQVELAKVLAIEELVDHPPIVLFDEPTSVLNPDEIKILFREIQRLRSRASIVFISHRLDEILEISDRVAVLTNGVKVADEQVSALDRDELYKLMVGHERKVRPRKERESIRVDTPGPRLKIRKLSDGSKFKNLDLDVARGEIVGLVGVQGSGAEEICRTVFGAGESVTGQITLDDKPALSLSPRDAVDHGIAYLPSNRRLEGMLAGRTLIQNMVVTYGLEYGRSRFFVDYRAEEAAATHWMQRLKVKSTSGKDRIERLSGGNQQKVVLGKWLMSKKLKLLLLDHPSRGLDPGARDDLFDAIREQAQLGMSIVFVADTSEEVIELADRIIVLRDGHITASHNLREGDIPSQEDIVKSMV
ncbi:sugar ABC transporter ATP-binding protein [Caballeronia sordidicola]|uniref:sugar ABC transporter ATP-binding protein n=1 Tax=Caballeronia sordidicola TaxID=196367 RepID=UPI0004CFEF2D|nr:sugar ABC transporter ATP-binding protein [Caballeronia sordidicola]